MDGAREPRSVDAWMAGDIDQAGKSLRRQIMLGASLDEDRHRNLMRAPNQMAPHNLKFARLGHNRPIYRAEVASFRVVVSRTRRESRQDVTNRRIAMKYRIARSDLAGPGSSADIRAACYGANNRSKMPERGIDPPQCRNLLSRVTKNLRHCFEAPEGEEGMTRTSTDLTNFATINLHYAVAEITSIGDRESVLRALEHIRQAERCLQVVIAEFGPLPDDAEPAAESEAA